MTLGVCHDKNVLNVISRPPAVRAFAHHAPPDPLLLLSPCYPHPDNLFSQCESLPSLHRHILVISLFVLGSRRLADLLITPLLLPLILFFFSAEEDCALERPMLVAVIIVAVVFRTKRRFVSGLT